MNSDGESLVYALQKLLCQHFELDRHLLDYINGK